MSGAAILSTEITHRGGIVSENKTLGFLSKQKTLIMATVGKDGAPTASYAPFVYHDNCFYVYVSDLSQHTKDVRETGHASILFIEDEQDAGNVFARKRLTFPCVCSVVRTESSRELLMELFAERFGVVFDLIRPLADFTLFQMTPGEGRSVAGFGQAYRVSKDLERLERVTGPGHTTQKVRKKRSKKK
jgi:hypothetical protein